MAAVTIKDNYVIMMLLMTAYRSIVAGRQANSIDSVTDEISLLNSKCRIIFASFLSYHDFWS